MAIPFLVIGEGLALLERLASLVKSIFGKGGKPTDPPAAPAANSGKPTTITRPRPTALLALLCAVALSAAGCASTFSANTLPELATLCEQLAPCEACPGTGASPVTPPAPPSTDAIPVDEIIWHHASPAKFAVTAELSDVRFNGRTVTWAATYPDSWPQWQASPDLPFVVGNPWVFAKIEGRWHASTFEWVRAGTQRIDLQWQNDNPPFIQAKTAPINAWRPKTGDPVCWMLSTLVRSGIKPASSPKERSPIVCTVWP